MIQETINTWRLGGRRREEGIFTKFKRFLDVGGVTPPLRFLNLPKNKKTTQITIRYTQCKSSIKTKFKNLCLTFPQWLFGVTPTHMVKCTCPFLWCWERKHFITGSYSICPYDVWPIRTLNIQQKCTWANPKNLLNF